MKVAIYTRVSTLEQAETGYSIEEQKERLEKYCEVREWEIYGVYSDPAYSGANINRPALQRMIQDCKLKKFDMVLVYKLDRLSRSQKDTLYLIEDVFQQNNISFTSVSENFDTSTPFGKAVVGVLSVFAQLEREQIKERMTMGKLGRARAGKAMSWSNVPFGYKYDKENQTLKVDEVQSKVVKDMYNDYLSGISITKLVSKLNNSGHIGKNINWSYRTVRAVLDNSTYTGISKYKGKEFPAKYNAIIDKATFEAVQNQLQIRQQTMLEKYNPRPFKAKYMLSGMMYCGYCTAIMSIGHSVTKKYGTRKYYRCASNSKKHMSNRQYPNCPNKKRYWKKDLEKLVIDTIKSIKIENYKKVPTSNVSNDEILVEISNVQTKLDKLIDLYLNSDDFTVEKLNTRKKELTERKKQLESQLSDVETELSIDEAEKILSVDIDNLSYEDKCMLVKSLIKRITAFEDELKIQWRSEQVK